MDKQMKSMVSAAICGLALVCAANAEIDYSYDWEPSGSYFVGKASSYVMPEEGEVYLKLSGIKAGQQYTFIANGSGASVDVMYVYSERSDGDTWVNDAVLSTGESDLKTDDQMRCIVYAEDWTDAYIMRGADVDNEEWSDNRVSPTAYYLHLEGEEGATINVTSSSGAILEPIPLGDVDNPKEIKPTALPVTYTAKYVDGSYYFYASLKAGSSYLFSTTGGTEEVPVALSFEERGAEFTSTNVAEAVGSVGNSAYLLTATKSGQVLFYVEGAGTSFGLTSQSATSGTLGRVTVTTKGANGSWSIKGATGTYASGDTVAILGAQTIVFSRMTGFTVPANVVATPTKDEPEVVIEGVYSDTFDPKDDAVAGATKISPSVKVGTAARSLFSNDKFDYFTFAAKDGIYYNFAFSNLVGDAQMTIFAKSDVLLQNPLSVSTVDALPKQTFAKGDYVIQVAHADGEEPVDASYALVFSAVNVGTVGFAKAAISAKKTAGTVAIAVNRTSAEGKVRVRYGTVNGTAKPGIDYVAQQGELVWENGDKKAKTITVKLIPELFAAEQISRQFSLELRAIDEDEIAEDEYPAALATSNVVVTVTQGKDKSTVVKGATTKTEVVPLETGTFQGVIAEDGSALTNGFPALASVSLTVKNATKQALSAKVLLGGKTYTFAGNAWDETMAGEGVAGAILTQVQKVANIPYTNTLEVMVATGATNVDGDWLKAGASVVLTMNVPDANGKGVQENIVYAGELFRDNAKVQDYLNVVTNAVGYYTMALAPSGVSLADGIPAGNGYLTMTVDNKGKVKIAGMLPDGASKPSYSSVVAVRDDGDTLLVPVFVAKAPYCFGGTVRLMRGEDGRYVVDSSESLLWNNDNALLTYDGEEGWRISLDPVGGYFNTVNHLQAYYLTHAFSVLTGEIDEFPTEALADGFSYVTDVGPNGKIVSLKDNAIATEKKALVKVDSGYDLAGSVNPCNVQVKLARATGLVTGSFSLWSETVEGKQKELSGIKHYGVLLLSRDPAAPIDEEVMTAGFCNQTATITYYNESNQKKTRKFTASIPFNIIAADDGAPDWYADDWGDLPEEN